MEALGMSPVVYKVIGFDLYFILRPISTASLPWLSRHKPRLRIPHKFIATGNKIEDGNSNNHNRYSSVIQLQFVHLSML